MFDEDFGDDYEPVEDEYEVESDSEPRPRPKTPETTAAHEEEKRPLVNAEHTGADLLRKVVEYNEAVHADWNIMLAFKCTAPISRNAERSKGVNWLLSFISKRTGGPDEVYHAEMILRAPCTRNSSCPFAVFAQTATGDRSHRTDGDEHWLAVTALEGRIGAAGMVLKLDAIPSDEQIYRYIMLKADRDRFRAVIEFVEAQNTVPPMERRYNKDGCICTGMQADFVSVLRCMACGCCTVNDAVVPTSRLVHTDVDEDGYDVLRPDTVDTRWPRLDPPPISSHWMCSELVASCLLWGGIVSCERLRTEGATPGLLHQVVCDPDNVLVTIVHTQSKLAALPRRKGARAPPSAAGPYARPSLLARLHK